MGNCDSRVLCKIISHDVLGETQSSSEMELIPIILTRNPGLECSPIVNIVSQLMNHNKRSETQKKVMTFKELAMDDGSGFDSERGNR